MASKLGFILSLLFVAMIFVILGDVVAVQFIYTNMDAVSLSAGYMISKNGYITNEVVMLVENECGASIEAVNDSVPMYGSLYEFRIYRDYEPLFISDNTMEISIVRSIIIGYYN